MRLRLLLSVAASAAIVFLWGSAAIAGCSYELDRETTVRGGEFFALGEDFAMGEYIEFRWGTEHGQVVDTYVVSDPDFRRRLVTPSDARFGWTWIVAVVNPRRANGDTPSYTVTRGIEVVDPSAAAGSSADADDRQPPADHTPASDPAERPASEPAAQPQPQPQPAVAPARQPATASEPAAARRPVAARAPAPVRRPASAGQPAPVLEPLPSDGRSAAGTAADRPWRAPVVAPARSGSGAAAGGATGWERAFGVASEAIGDALGKAKQAPAGVPLMLVLAAAAGLVASKRRPPAARRRAARALR